MRAKVSDFFGRSKKKAVRKKATFEQTIGMPEQVALQERVEQVSLSSFGQPFRHVAVFNSRLQTTGGRYHLSDHHLDFNPKMAKRADFDAVIKHELCHYHLHLAGRGYRHRDQDFKRLLQQVGGSRYAPDVGARRTVQRKYHYLCENGHSIDRVRPVDVQRYRCARCRGRLYPR